MYYTEEQFNALTPVADELRRAIDHNYAHNPGAKTLDAIREAYISASGTKRYPRNWGCSACVVQLMKDAGRLYFADLDERNAAALEAANAAAAAEATKEAAAAPAPLENVQPAPASEGETAAPANGESTEEQAAPKEAPKTAPKRKTGKTPAKTEQAPETEK